MNQLGYLNENAQRQYPLRDNTDTVFGSSYVLPTTVLLDLQINLRDISGISGVPTFQLSSINTSANTIVFSGSLTFTFNYTTNGVQTIFAQNGSNDATLVMDSDALLQYLSVNSISAGLYTFTSPPQVCASCIRFQPSMVSALTLKNTTGGNYNDINYNTTFGSGSTVSLIQGSNIGYTASGDTLGLSVSAGAGTGLFDGCRSSTNYITSINNQTADANGNVILQMDGCIRLTPELNTLMVGNICDTTCTNLNIIDLAYYINRVSYRKDELGVLLSTLGANYQAAIALQSSVETEKSSLKAPYVTAICNTQSNSANIYNSITCGFYSPNVDSILATPHVSYATATPPSMFTLQDAQTTFLQNDVQSKVPLSLFTGSSPQSRYLSANSASFLGFVLSQPTNITPNFGNPGYDVSFGIASGSFFSGYILPIGPQSANFCVSYTIDIVAHTMTLNIMPAIGNASQTGGTSGTALIQVGYTGSQTLSLTASSMVVSQRCPTPINQLKWSGTLDLSDSSTFSLTFSGVGSTTCNFTVGLSSNYGSASKTFTVTV